MQLAHGAPSVTYAPSGVVAGHNLRKKDSMGG